MSRWKIQNSQVLSPPVPKFLSLKLHPEAHHHPVPFLLGNPLKTYSGTSVLTFAPNSLQDETKIQRKKQLCSLPNIHQWWLGQWQDQLSKRETVGHLNGNTDEDQVSWRVEGFIRIITVRCQTLGTLSSNCLPESLSTEDFEECTDPVRKPPHHAV